MTQKSFRSDRKSTRYDVTLDVEIFHDGQIYEGRTKNLSLGGMLVKTVARLPFGARLNLRFSIPTLNEPMDVKANIRWIEKKDCTADPNRTGEAEILVGIGLQFEGLRAKHVWALNKFFESIAASPQNQSKELELETASGEPA